jgi:hypothetical protein
MSCSKAVMIVLYSLAFWSCVFADLEDGPVITRGTYDLLHYPDCDKTKAQSFDCNGIAAERFGDVRLCQCRCKVGYLAYRDPAVEYNRTRDSYDLKDGIRKCVWHGLYREGT